MGRRYGSKFGVKCFCFVIKHFDIRLAYVILAFVTPFFALKSGIIKSASYYLKRRFPGDSGIIRKLRVFKYIYNFGLVLIDQAALGILPRDAFKINFPQENELRRLGNLNKGIVLIVSHTGAWKIAMGHSRRLGKPINFLIQLDGDARDINFFDISGRQAEYNFINPSGYMGGMIEAANALQNKECVAVTGDRKLRWRYLEAEFLGSKARFPIVAEHLAVATGSYLVILLTKRTGKLAYALEHIELTQLVRDKNRFSRQELIRAYLETYVRTLETYVKNNPYMWFNFYDFWKTGPGQ